MSRKRVLVTGASGGIGRVLCRHLAMKGYDLIMAARDTAKLSELVQTLSGEFGGCHSVQGVDFSSSDSVQSAVAQQVATSGEINGMVIMPPQAPSTFECLPADAEWEDLFRRCFVNPLALLRGLLPKMENQTRSKVVIISGISSAQVLSHYATSNVLRCAWLGQAKTLAFAFGNKGIHFNTVSLGGTLTEKYKQGIESRGSNVGRSFNEQLADETSNIPLQKYGTPEEVALVVETLLSPFSDHLTGVNLLCDGGFTRAY